MRAGCEVMEEGLITVFYADNRSLRSQEYSMLRSIVHHYGLCCMMLAYVASNLKLVKLFAQHMPTILSFS